VLRRVESRRFRGREGGRGPTAAAVAPFYSGDAAAVGHGARARGAVGHDTRVPAAAPHGGRNLAPLGSRADNWRHP
jgi:hypothetical protein